MTIDLHNETPIRFSEIPGWCEETIGHRVNRSTCHRWRTRGCRGVKLETTLVGGTRYSTIEALERFFAGATAAADGNNIVCITGGMTDPAAIQRAESYLESEGI